MGVPVWVSLRVYADLSLPFFTSDLLDLCMSLGDWWYSDRNTQVNTSIVLLFLLCRIRFWSGRRHKIGNKWLFWTDSSLPSSGNVREEKRGSKDLHFSIPFWRRCAIEGTMQSRSSQTTGQTHHLNWISVFSFNVTEAGKPSLSSSKRAANSQLCCRETSHFYICIKSLHCIGVFKK